MVDVFVQITYGFLMYLMKYGQTFHASDRTTRCECSTEGPVAECATTSSDGVEEMHLPGCEKLTAERHVSIYHPPEPWFWVTKPMIRERVHVRRLFDGFVVTEYLSELFFYMMSVFVRYTPQSYIYGILLYLLSRIEFTYIIILMIIDHTLGTLELL